MAMFTDLAGITTNNRMETSGKTMITVETVINAPVKKIWKCWTEPRHITKWCFASDDWHAPHAENDFRVGGSFITTMAAKDGSSGFDVTGTYNKIKKFELIEYILDDGRTVSISFKTQGDHTRVTESFEAETENTLELQRSGWQAILDNFKKHVETLKSSQTGG
jgi:uncharacterized protein YndB with AHSA1/START domain